MKLFKKLNKSKSFAIHGFTLIEIMLVLTLFGILAAIAYPSFTSYLLKSRRWVALSALRQSQMQLEACYAQHFSYTAPCLNAPTFPQNSSENHYLISLSQLGPTSYTLTAVPQGAQAKDSSCSRIMINQANVKTAVNSSGDTESDCWG